jgi:hypothetical protein
MAQSAASAALVGESENTGQEFWLARLLYYGGMCFVAAGALRPIPSLDVSDCFFLASLIVAIGTAVLKGGAVRVPLPRLFVVGLLVFAVGALVSLPEAVHPTASAGALARFTYTTLVWFALGAVVLRQRSHIQIAAAAWLTSVAASGVAGIAQVLLGPNVLGFINNPFGRHFRSTSSLLRPPGGFESASQRVRSCSRYSHWTFIAFRD